MQRNNKDFLSFTIKNGTREVGLADRHLVVHQPGAVGMDVCTLDDAPPRKAGGVCYATKA